MRIWLADWLEESSGADVCPALSIILSECATKHLGHKIICEALDEGDDYWFCQLKGYIMPLPELCTLMFLSGLPSQDWDDTLPDEGGSTVDGFGMLFCDYLISHQLGLGWKYRVIGKEGLWLVGVSGACPRGRALPALRWI